MAKVNDAKQALLYKTIDESDFYSNPVAQNARFDECAFSLSRRKLNKAFLEGADQRGLLNLKGHRSVGGMRASIYNAVSLPAVEALVAYMQESEKEHA